MSVDLERKITEILVHARNRVTQLPVKVLRVSHEDVVNIHCDNMKDWRKGCTSSDTITEDSQVEGTKMCHAKCSHSINNGKGKKKVLKTKTGFVSNSLYSKFENLLRTSEVYRDSFCNFIEEADGAAQTDSEISDIVIFVDSNVPEGIDYLWSQMLNQKIWEFMQLMDLMSLLSTLGGAYSSLGDQFLPYAKTAGAISAKQMRVALRLGNPAIVARCKIYFSISLIQTGRLQFARRLLKNIYYEAVSVPEERRDGLLVNMCKGVWAKLQFTWRQKRPNRGIVSSEKSSVI